MDLKQKLRRLPDGGPGRGHAASSGETEDVARLRASDTRARATESVEGPEQLPGALHDTPHGPLHVIARELAPDARHGATPIRGATEVLASSVAKLALDPAFEEVDFERMLLLDTETTGLHLGTGTLPFLVGMGWFEGGRLRVQQLLLREPGREAPMLQWLGEKLAEASCIVTFNGKSFDWPLLRGRYIMTRTPMPEPPRHLDLLPCARRVFKRRMDSVRLIDLETEVLGMERAGDVDGSQIPDIYLRWLREGTGAESELTNVIRHNDHDLVALAALLSRLVAQFEALSDADDPRDHLGYAEVAARAGDEARADTFARAAARGGGDGACTTRAWMLTARLARRRGDHDEERVALEHALRTATGLLEQAEAHLALAKLHEHRFRDVATALVHAAHTEAAEGPHDHARRMARLRRKGAGQPSRLL